MHAQGVPIFDYSCLPLIRLFLGPPVSQSACLCQSVGSAHPVGHRSSASSPDHNSTFVSPHYYSSLPLVPRITIPFVSVFTTPNLYLLNSISLALRSLPVRWIISVGFLACLSAYLFFASIWPSLFAAHCQAIDCHICIYCALSPMFWFDMSSPHIFHTHYLLIPRKQVYQTIIATINHICGNKRNCGQWNGLKHRIPTSPYNNSNVQELTQHTIRSSVCCRQTETIEHNIVKNYGRYTAARCCKSKSKSSC